MRLACVIFGRRSLQVVENKAAASSANLTEFNRRGVRAIKGTSVVHPQRAQLLELGELMPEESWGKEIRLWENSSAVT